MRQDKTSKYKLTTCMLLGLSGRVDPRNRGKVSSVWDFEILNWNIAKRDDLNCIPIRWSGTYWLLLNQWSKSSIHSFLQASVPYFFSVGTTSPSWSMYLFLVPWIPTPSLPTRMWSGPASQSITGKLWSLELWGPSHRVLEWTKHKGRLSVS